MKDFRRDLFTFKYRLKLYIALGTVMYWLMCILPQTLTEYLPEICIKIGCSPVIHLSLSVSLSCSKYIFHVKQHFDSQKAYSGEKCKVSSFHSLYSSPDKSRTIKTRRTR
jgi:hypothetical protein